MQTSEAAAPKAANAWFPYVLPIALYIFFSAVLEEQLRDHYVWIYIAKVVVVMAAVLACRRPWKDIRFDAKLVAPAVIAGLALSAFWVLVEKYIPYPHPSFLGSRPGFNPFKEIADPVTRSLFLGVRLFGLVVMVSLVEEIFWRSFLLRYVTKPEFEELPLDGFKWTAAGIVALVFGLAHPEWLVAVVFSMAMAWLLKQTKSLFACIVAHGTTNLALGVYILSTGDWKFW